MRKSLLILILVFFIQIVIAADPTFDDVPTDGITLNEDELFYFDVNASDAEDGNLLVMILDYLILMKLMV